MDAGLWRVVVSGVVRMTRPTYEELEERCRVQERRIAEQERRIAELESQVRRLTLLFEQAQRDGKRQAAPFSKGPPKLHPKKPGRKAGHNHGKHAHRQPPSPQRIDKVYAAPLPAACPCCSGTLELERVAHQYQTEIPRRPIHRRFDVHIGRCRNCGKRVQGRHPLQTSDALGAAASQIGPDAQAAITLLNKRCGLSHGKVRRTLKDLFDIEVSRGGSAQAMLRCGRRLAPARDGVIDTLRRAGAVTADETGWRVGGISAWLHAFVSEHHTVYEIDPRRDIGAAERILGMGYSGKLVRDGWAPYNKFMHATHQLCLAHPLRRCIEMLQTATRGAVRFPRQVKQLIRDALTLRDRRDAHDIGERGLAVSLGKLEARLDRLLRWTRTSPENERLAKHLAEHRRHVFTFLRHPGLEATNWRAEQAIRPAVVNRKVWGGNRTWNGADAQSILMTTLQTADQQDRDSLDLISTVLRDRIAPPALLASPHA